MLEFKEARKNLVELTKDVVAFANSSGGTLIFGISERNNKPESITWIENKGMKEKIENVFLSNIQPKFEDFLIKIIDNPKNSSKSIFVIDIEKSNNGPHMAADNRYYIRRNFLSEPMNDNEVRNVIFNNGLKDALVDEIKFNTNLAKKSYKKIEEIMRYNPDERAPIVFIPFRLESWRASVSSGLFSIIKKDIRELIEIYNLKYELNHYIELQKLRFEMIVTQSDDANPKFGKYIPSLISDKISKLLALLSNLNFDNTSDNN